MKKYLIIALAFIAILLIVYVFIQVMSSVDLRTTELESYKISEIHLENYEFEERGLGECVVPWWMTIDYVFAVDDRHHIYMLDIYKNKIVHLDSDGKLLRKMILKNVDFNNLSCDGDGQPLIQVSSQGDFFYIKSGDYKRIAIYNHNGLLIKKITSPGYIARDCSDTFKTNNDVLDKNLNILKYIVPKNSSGFFDSKYNLYSLDSPINPVLIKKSIHGEKIWDKQIKGYKQSLGFLGFDKEDNLYILMHNPSGIVKINKDGLIVAKITLPQNQNGTFKVLCDGTIYFFPSNVEIVQNKAQKAKDEYSIYKFEKK